MRRIAAARQNDNILTYKSLIHPLRWTKFFLSRFDGQEDTDASAQDTTCRTGPSYAVGFKIFLALAPTCTTVPINFGRYM